MVVLLTDIFEPLVIAGYIQAGEDNLKIAQRLADTYAGTAETMTLLTGDQADYFADKSGFEVHILDKFNTKVSMTWNLIAPLKVTYTLWSGSGIPLCRILYLHMRLIYACNDIAAVVHIDRIT